jgi:hypothetical protein
VGNLALLVLEGRRLLRFAVLLLLHVIVVVARVPMQGPGPQLEDAVAQRVEERAIVGNHH